MNRLGFAVIVGILCSGPLPAGGMDFIRGDVNGDGLLGVGDALQILNSIVFASGPQPITSCPPTVGAVVLDAADFNDNEFITIADPVRITASLFLGPTLPLFPPTTCGPDPTTDPGGFATVDPAYHVYMGIARPVPGVGSDPVTKVRYPIWIETPSTIPALELYFANPDLAALSNPTFVGLDELGASLDTVLSNVTILRLADIFDLISGVGPGINFLGSLEYTLAPGAVAPQLEWVPEYFNLFQRRATLVDNDYNDHWPGFTVVTSPIFFRGDVSSDGITNQPDGMVGPADLTYLQNYTWHSFPTPVTLCGPLQVPDALDINDNEHVSIADELLLAAYLAGSVISPLPLPSGCGPDPSESQQGFDLRDPQYRVVASDLTIVINTPADIRALVDLDVTVPGDVRGVQFTVELPPGVTPLSPLMVLDPGVGLGVAPTLRFRYEEPLLTIAVLQPTGLLFTGGGTQALGVLRLDLPDPVLPGPIGFVADAQIQGRTYRATVVDGQFRDHHPVTGAGQVRFIRGDSNNQSGVNGAVDIGDPIFLFDYLFSQGPIPVCFDAADVNNDGKVDIGDPITALNYLFSVTTDPLPPPFPSCGIDNDIDLLDCQGLAACP